MADPLAIAGSVAGLVGIAEVVVRTFYRYGKAVRGARAEIAKLRAEVESFYGLLQTLKVIAQEIEQEPLSLPPALPFINNCQTILETVRDALVKAHASSSFKWPLNSSKTKELLQDLQRQKSILSIALAADEVKAILKALGGIDTLQGEVEQISRQLEAVSRIIVNKESQRILDEYSSLNPRGNYEANLRIRHSGTGRWVIDSDEYQSWMNTRNSGLWLFGIPGAGKTIISATIIEHTIRVTSLPSSDSAIVYFFCDYKSELTQSPQNILASLVRQIARQHQTSYNKAAEYYKNRTLSGAWSVPPVEELCSLFVEMCTPFEDVMVIVDGVDECGKQQTKVAKNLRDLKDQSQNVKVLLLSRDEPDIQQQLKSLQRMSIAAQNKDLRLYVAAEIERRLQNGELELRDMKLKEEIMDVFINGAQGMFHWVACQMDYICELPTDSSRRAALRTLPPTLSGTYERIIERAFQKDKYSQIILQRSLQWVVTWKRSFPVDALCEAVSIEVVDTKVCVDSIPLKKNLLRICSSFIRLTADDRLEPAHFTVKVNLDSPSKAFTK